MINWFLLEREALDIRDMLARERYLHKQDAEVAEIPLAEWEAAMLAGHYAIDRLLS